MELRATTLAGSASPCARTVSGRRVPTAPRPQHHHLPTHPQPHLQHPGGLLRSPLPAASRPHLTSTAASAPSSGSTAPLPEPETAREAIDQGNQLAKQARWQEALVLYERALTLPGTGIKRYRDRPPQASDGERAAALFNAACCQAQLGDMRAGLVALAGCLEAGYDDFQQLRSDPDLAPLRGDERFEGLLRRFERPSAPLGGFLGGLFGGKK
ncbi:hypothetical protein Agub_g11585 [Astrephomene gubernaculifera]|uniref:Uncharacterized protein n=1 Tax=Astrephomene gubernaculifera TaxID=47775 RepID=A0AAD3DWV8_9CHLO|nr:hypothetical protein Agub_g11585 [Astrephomene gubernaculifera]